MSDLDQLAQKYGTDKSSMYHGYTSVYERKFAPLRSDTTRLLELGIAKGLSLRMWRDYFPRALVVGVDIDPSTAFNEERIVTTIGNDADPSIASTVGLWGPFDIVIDDGGHQMVEQQANWRLYFPMVRAGGIYVIEDLHTSYWRNYGGGGGGTTIDMLKGFVDSVNLRGAREYAHHRGASEAPDWEPPELERDIASIEFCRSLCFITKK